MSFLYKISLHWIVSLLFSVITSVFVIQNYFTHMVFVKQILSYGKLYFVCKNYTHMFQSESLPWKFNLELYNYVIYLYLSAAVGSVISGFMTKIKRVKTYFAAIGYITSLITLVLLLFDVLKNLNSLKWAALVIGFATGFTLPFLRTITVNWMSDHHSFEFLTIPISHVFALFFWNFLYFQFEFQEVFQRDKSILWPKYGIIIVCAVLFFLLVWYVTDSPHQNKKLNRENMNDLDFYLTPNSEEEKFNFPIRTILRSLNTWIYIFLQIGSFWSLYVIYFVGYLYRYSLQTDKHLEMYPIYYVIFLIIGLLLAFMGSRIAKEDRPKTTALMFFAMLSLWVPGFGLYSISVNICRETKEFMGLHLIMCGSAFIVYLNYYFGYRLLAKHFGFVSGIADASSYAIITLIIKFLNDTILYKETLESWNLFQRILSSVPVLIGFFVIILIALDYKNINEDIAFL